jgi:PKD repeat protein
MKNTLQLLLCLAIYLSIQSCSKKPFACFRTDVAEDSIHVNQVVTFTALCSTNARDYSWEFSDKIDSIAFSPNVTRIFADTGEVEVYLLVTNGRKQSTSSRNIYVHP